MRNKKKLLLIFLAISIHNYTFSLKFDDFSEDNPGPEGLTTSTELTSLLTDKTATINRTIQQLVKDDPTTLTISDSTLYYSGKKQIGLAYSPSAGFFDLSGFSTFNLKFTYTEAKELNNKLGIGIALKDQNLFTYPRVNFINSQSLQFDYTNLIPSIDLTQVKLIQFTLNDTYFGNIGEEGLKFTVHGIDIVPEPLSITTLAVGALFIKKRRKTPS